LSDPLGLTGPVIVVAKIIIQKLWLEKIALDEDVPDIVCVRWKYFCEELKTVIEIRISRWLDNGKDMKIEVHSLSDISLSTYGACIYICSISTNRECIVSILGAISRVAPL